MLDIMIEYYDGIDASEGIDVLELIITTLLVELAKISPCT